MRNVMASFRLGINEIRRAFYKDTKIGFAQIQNLKIYQFFSLLNNSL